MKRFILCILLSGCAANAVERPYIVEEQDGGSLVDGSAVAQNPAVRAADDRAKETGGQIVTPPQGGTSGQTEVADAEVVIPDSGIADGGTAGQAGGQAGQAGESSAGAGGQGGSSEAGTDAGQAGAAGQSAGVGGSQGGTGGTEAPDAGPEDSGTGDSGEPDSGVVCGESFCSDLGDVGSDLSQWERQSFLTAVTRECDGEAATRIDTVCDPSSTCEMGYDEGGTWKASCTPNCGNPEWPDLTGTTKFEWDKGHPTYELMVDSRGCGGWHWWSLGPSQLSADKTSVVDNLVFFPNRVDSSMDVRVAIQVRANATSGGVGDFGSAGYADIKYIEVTEYQWRKGKTTDVWSVYLRMEIKLFGTYLGRNFELNLSYRNLFF